MTRSIPTHPRRSPTRSPAVGAAVLAGLILAGLGGCAAPVPPPSAPGPVTTTEAGANAVAAAAAERIARIEATLMAPVQLEGRAAEAHTLAERMAHWQVPGVSVAVIAGGDVAWSKAWGVEDEESGDPVTPTTLFQAASISKPVSVMGMLRLVEAGELALDEPVGTYLSSWQIPPYDFDEAVTLRRLASHTAGTNVHGFPGYARSAEHPTTEGVLRGEGNTDAVVVELEPGSEWRYSGGGTTILQLVVEETTGLPFEVYMAGAVLEPAGMTHSTFAQPLPERRWDDAAVGHRADGTRVEEGWHVYPEKAAAGLWTTPTDLARLAVEVQRSLRGESNAILSREMTERMLEPVENGYGLGFSTEVGPTGRFGHGGANEGYRASLTAFRDGRGVVVMTNGEQGSALAQELMMAIGREYGWGELRPRTLAPAPLTSEQRDQIAGAWVIPAMGIRLTLTPTDEGIFVAESNAIPSTEYVPVSETQLRGLTPAPPIEVVWEDGRVVGLRAQGQELVRQQ